MIRFVGGKVRHAKQIAEVLTPYARDCSSYVEPFFGGGGMIEYTRFGIPRIASDIDKDLIELYRAIQDGWLPPERISSEEYVRIKSAPSSPLRTYVGYGCSFGGKWFGGYARDKSGKRDLSHESYNRVIKNRAFISDIDFRSGDYRELVIPDGSLVYCDPPYAESLGYKNEFNHEEFWEYIRRLSKSNYVFVSEYSAPNDFVSIWEKESSVNIHHKVTGNKKVEKLFMLQ